MQLNRELLIGKQNFRQYNQVTELHYSDMQAIGELEFTICYFRNLKEGGEGRYGVWAELSVHENCGYNVDINCVAIVV